MAKHKFVANHEGFREILRRQSTQQRILGICQEVASRMGEGYVADVQPGKNRAQGMVKPATREADEDNRRNNTLLKGGNGGAP
ncbi:hypothetical protein U6G28_08795 [Actinomycetaceae bacterium MB13-C1-2]|nr:hypothetical protein U6G28_08795 [Actinomycetaceae bacterium MB13-C1-2]